MIPDNNRRDLGNIKVASFPPCARFPYFARQNHQKIETFSPSTPDVDMETNLSPPHHNLYAPTPHTHLEQLHTIPPNPAFTSTIYTSS